MKPLAIDLFCGLGGWADGFLAEGYDVIGYDIDPRFAESYPATFIQADVRELDGREFRGATVIVASPPCTEYGTLRWALNPELRRRPDTTLWDAAVRVSREASVPIVLENVQGARRWHPGCRANFGPYYLWYDVPLIPQARYGRSWRKDIFTSQRGTRHADARSLLAAEAARIPLPLARAVARGFLPMATADATAYIPVSVAAGEGYLEGGSTG